MEYLNTHIPPNNLIKAQCNYTKIEAKDYEYVANELYKRGKDKQLWLCVTKVYYGLVLEGAHASQYSGHTIDTIAKAIMTARLW